MSEVMGRSMNQWLLEMRADKYTHAGQLQNGEEQDHMR